MDLFKVIEERVRYFSSSDNEDALRNIVLHIKIAEEHYNNAKNKSGDYKYLYTDAIYRTNQAFEGALKEAYSLFTKKDGKKLKAHQLEDYFSKNKIVERRISQLFKNYRENWRNQSSHDYNLSFYDEEAFLAIVNISAFFVVLLDKMIKVKSYENEKKENKSKNNREPLTVDNGIQEAVIESIGLFFEKYTDDLRENNYSSYYESELSGIFLANIEDEDKFEIETNLLIATKENESLPFDYIIYNKLDKNEKLAVDLKLAKSISSSNMVAWRKNILKGISSLNIKYGVLFIPPSTHTSLMVVDQHSYDINEKKYIITEIYPDNSEIEVNYYWLNSNKRHAGDNTWKKMIENNIGCTYGPESYGNKLKNLKVNDIVFLYLTSKGIIARGVVTSLFSGIKNEKPVTVSEDSREYSIGVNWNMKLTPETALKAAELRRLGHNMFLPTLFKVNKVTAKLIEAELKNK